MARQPGRGPLPDAPARSPLRALYRQFSPAFWVVNSVELLERAAYYGMNSAFFLWFARERGFDTGLLGLLNAVLIALLYFVPLVAGALAEKVGYRRAMTGAFTFASLGYLALALSGSLEAGLGAFALVPGILLLGLGAGIFKPIAAAAVARASSVEQRNFGFTIYYAFINIGGFLGPLAVALLLPQALYGLVFYGAAVLVALSLAMVLLTYRDSVPPQRDVRVTQALRNMLELRRDPWFLALLVVYAGFWYMYAQTLFAPTLYGPDFGVVPPEVPAALLLTVNPAVIILFGPALGKALGRIPSLPLVIGGTALGVLGILLIAFAPSLGGFVLGIAVFSLGEVIVHPSFLSYASKVAPKDRTALYLGFAFIPVGVGLVVGSAAGLSLYARFAEQAHTPAVFWGVAAAVGVATIAGLLLVNGRLAGRGDPAMRELGGRTRRILGSRATPMAALVVVPLVVLASLVPGPLPFTPGGRAPALEPSGELAAEAVRLAPLTGEVEEGASVVAEVVVPDAAARNLTFTLRWTDEPSLAPPPAPGNAPDRLQLAVRTPDGREFLSDAVPNPAGGEGRIDVVVPALAGVPTDGTYALTVTAVDCGDTAVGPLAAVPDTGNAWTLEAAYEAPPAA